VEFSYKNGYLESLKMSPFKALYGWSCNTRISWNDLVNRVLIGIDMLDEMEQELQVIRRNLKATHDRKKSYANQNKAFKEFQVGEHAYFQIKSKTRSLRIGSCAKLAPRYCRPFEILERIGRFTYRFALPPTMKLHDVFHVSLLKGYVYYVDNVIDWSVL